jgi:superfamily II DNA/RNA helicase
MTQFSDLKLDPKVLKAIDEAGYTTPTPIQAQAIPHALEGRDVLGIAQTGTGKTASFTLPLITRLGRGRARARMPRSLVLAPTRELAAQVAENFDTYAKYTRLTKALLIGGVAFGEQDKLIDRGVDVLIATPGRLLDHFERGKLLLTGVEVMVVDEADRMLDMGFIPDIERIFGLTPFTRQTFFYSATMAPEIERITNTFLSNPARIEIARQATASETIAQELIELPATRRDGAAKLKREALRAIIKAEGDKIENAVIFCNRKVDVDILSKSLQKYKFDAAPIHGDLDQSVRTRTLEKFRAGELRLLIASDVAARGLDVPSVSHVINYDLPSHPEDYVHRIGRTGRAGRSGKAISLMVPADQKYLDQIEALLQKPLPRGTAPDIATPTETPEAESERPRSRTRDRDRKPRAKPAPEAQAQIPAPAQAPVQATATPAAKPQAEAPQPEKAQLHQFEDAKAARGPRGAPTQGRNRPERGDNRNDQRGAVVGMGDHVPDFLMRQFRSA